MVNWRARISVLRLVPLAIAMAMAIALAPSRTLGQEILPVGPSSPPSEERSQMLAAIPSARALAVTSRLVELVLPELPYAFPEGTEPAAYRVTSSDDRDFAGGVAPVAVQYRFFPELAPYRPQRLVSGGDLAHIMMVYRIDLELSKPLKAGRSYVVDVDPGVVPAGPFALAYDAAPTEAIHVNQVAYQAQGPKTAYVSWWTGEGAITCDAPHFQLIDESTGRVAFTGDIVQTAQAADEPWSRSNVYAADFGAFATPGRYHVEVPGIGRSFSFGVSRSAFAKDIGFTIVRGLFMQRDGNHGLDRPELTAFVRPRAHLTDAIDEATGMPLPLAGGHMDAGDRGHYTHHSAEACANLLAPTFLFPGAIEALGESLNIPETGNGVPDYVDELLYELDWLASLALATPLDGALGFAVRTQNFGYELGQPLAGATGRVFFDKSHGPLRAETLYAAGALAMACNSPMLRRMLPKARLARYRRAALRAWSGFERHDADDSFWKDGAGWLDPWDPHKQSHAWSDELVFAAASLLQLTGEAKYLDWIRRELPADLDGLRTWGWVTTGPWLHAFFALANVTDARLDDATRARARAAVIRWAEAETGVDGKDYAAPFGAPLPRAVEHRLGWYFSNTFASMLALGLTGDDKYRDRIIRSWNYLLGTNAMNRSFFTGIGDADHRPHWLAHEVSYVAVSRLLLGDPAGWPDVAPGLPTADVQMGTYPPYYSDAWNQQRAARQFPPAGASYPILDRTTDAWNTDNEFTIERQTQQIASLVPIFVETGSGRSAAPAGR